MGLELTTSTSRVACSTDRASQAPQSLKPNKARSHPSQLPKSQVPTQRALALSNLAGFGFLTSYCNILLERLILSPAGLVPYSLVFIRGAPVLEANSIFTPTSIIILYSPTAIAPKPHHAQCSGKMKQKP